MITITFLALVLCAHSSLVPWVDTKASPDQKLDVPTLQTWCSLAQAIRGCRATCGSSSKTQLVQTLQNSFGIYDIPDSALPPNNQTSPASVIGLAPCPQFKWVSPDQMKMWYQLWPGPQQTPVVVVGGWSVVKEDWQDVAGAWSKIRPVLAMDVRGVGQTGLGPTPGNYSAPQIARDIADLIKQVFQKDQKVFLVGVSMGGKIALQLAVDFPELFAGVIIGATGGGGKFAAPGPRFNEFAQLLLTGQYRIRVYRYAQAIYSPKWAANNVLRWLFLLARGSLYNRPQEGILRQANIALTADLSGEAADVNQPTLCVHGTDDVIVESVASQRLCAGIGSNGRYEELTNDGHAFWQMDPPEFIKDAEVFFQQI